MAKKSPRLTLVDAPILGASEPAAGPHGLRLFALGELSEHERTLAGNLIHSAAAKSGVIGVARHDLPWDLRPVLMVPGEDQPSLVRSVGPDVSRNEELAARTREVFELLERYPGLKSGLIEWGECEGQIYFRRTMPRTVLAEQLDASSIDFDGAADLLETLVDELGVWHSNGVSHGHLSTGNISLSDTGDLIFLDPVVAAACATAGKGQPLSPDHALAPELTSGNGWSYGADIYSLGQVFRRILLAVRRHYQYSEERQAISKRLRPLQNLAESMCEPEVRDRPGLSEVRNALREAARRAKRSAQKAAGAAPRPAASVSTEAGELPAAVESEDSLPVDVPERRRTIRQEPAKTAARGRVIRRSESDADFFDSRAAQELENRQEAAVGNELLDVLDEQPVASGGASGAGRQRTAQRPPTNEQAGDVGLAWGEPLEEPEKEEEDRSRGIWPLVAILSILLIGFWYYRTAGLGDDAAVYQYSELKAAWESRIPSQMLTVAEVAVQKDVDNKLVQDLIVSSAKRGEELPAVINVPLLRIAFHDRWEVSLSSEDRRVAISLALVGLLREKMPTDLDKLENRHPGILLAVTESAGEQTRKILESIPAAALAKLPAPYGPAFLRLSGTEEMMSCADPRVQLLARFAMRGIERSAELEAFLQGDSLRNLQSLVLVYSHSEKLSKELLDALLSDPSVVIDIPEVRWAKDWGIMSWDELEDPDKLFIISGIAPTVPVRAENAAKLFMHPVPSMRSFGIDQALASASFKHPGAGVVLNQLSKNPEMLSPEQLFRLGVLLSDPDKVNDERIQSWLATEPPREFVAKLLLSTQPQASSTKLDTWLALYLKTKGWSPEVDDLRALAMHPDDYSRLYAYAEILKLKDESLALKLLGEALTREKNPKYSRQLQMMIEQLQPRPQ